MEDYLLLNEELRVPCEGCYYCIVSPSICHSKVGRSLPNHLIIYKSGLSTGTSLSNQTCKDVFVRYESW